MASMFKNRDVTELAKICICIHWMIRIHWMPISRAKSVGCGFVAQSKLVPAIIATMIQRSYLKLNSYKNTSSEYLKSLGDFTFWISVSLIPKTEKQSSLKVRLRNGLTYLPTYLLRPKLNLSDKVWSQSV